MKWQGKEWKNETGHNFKKTLSFEKDPVNRSYLQSMLSIAKKHFKMLESDV